MPLERTPKRRGDADLAMGVAERAAVVWRLALQAGLTPEQAEDVCVVTLQDAVRAPDELDGLDRMRRGWLLRTTLEQCTVARTLASDRGLPYPDGAADVTTTAEAAS